MFEFSQAANGTGIFDEEDCLANGGSWGDMGYGFTNGGGGTTQGSGPSLQSDPPGCTWVPNPDQFGTGQPILNCDTSGSSGAGPKVAGKGGNPNKDNTNNKYANVHVASWQIGPMHYGACIDRYYHSWAGKGVQFLAPTTLIPGWNPGAITNTKNWAEAIASKTVLLKIATAGGSTGQIVNYSIVGGTATVTASELSGVVAAGGAVLGPITAAGMGAATITDVIMHGACALNAAVSVGFP